MFILGNTRVANRSDEGNVFKGVEGLSHLLLSEIEHGVAAGALVAGVDQGVERQRIIFRRCDLFFDEGAENAELDGVEMHTYKVATSR
jgi:hypothetical protein